MKLYSGPLTMFGHKVEIALREKNIDCEIERVPFGMRKRYDPKHPEVMRINPKGQIPVLVSDNTEIYDSTQIFEYLEDTHPTPPLWPDSPSQRANARLLELEADEVFFPFVQAIYRSLASSDNTGIDQAKQGAQAYFSKIDALLSDRDYLCETFSYADIALLCAHYYGDFVGINISPEHQRLLDWRARMADRQSVKSVLSETNNYLKSKGMTAPSFIVV